MRAEIRDLKYFNVRYASWLVFKEKDTANGNVLLHVINFFFDVIVLSRYRWFRVVR